MMIEDRERIVLETLEKIPKQSVVLIGGYAINAYVPPRFSIDCDLVVLGRLERIENELKKNAFVKSEKGDVVNGRYLRYERKKEKVSFDLLVNSAEDRQMNIVFEKELFEKYSKERASIGRANPVRIELRIADPELLFTMKFVTGRRQDIRDMFMLAGEDLKWGVVSSLLSLKCSRELVEKRSKLIEHSITSKSFRDSIQGPFGKMPQERFESCKRKLSEFLGSYLTDD